jgi:adenine phosphoribosyltransferase
MNLKDFIRSIPDYPKKGILFRDITTLIKDEKLLQQPSIKLLRDQKILKLIKLRQLKVEDLCLLQQYHICLKNLLLC